MKRRSLVLSLFVLGVFVSASSAARKAGVASHQRVSIVIRHETRGCHAWAIGSRGQFKAGLKLTVAAGSTLSFVNNDVMPQKIVQKTGPKASFAGRATLDKKTTKVQVLLAKPGVYRFGTVAGEDYVKGIETVGEDNVLSLVVTVK